MLQKGEILEAVINGKLNGAIQVMDMLGDDIHPVLKSQLEFFIEEMKEVIAITKELNTANKN